MSSIAGQRGWVGQWAGLIEPPKLGGWLRACLLYCTYHSLDVPVAAPKRRGSGASDAIPLVYLVRSVKQPAIVTQKYAFT